MRRTLLSLCFYLPLSLLAQKDLRSIYDYVFPYREDMALVMKGDKYGFVNRNGEEVIPPIYIMAEGFSEGFAAVELDDSAAVGKGEGTYIFIDKTGKQVLPQRYQYIDYSFKQGLAVVTKGEKTLVINNKGQVVVEPASNWKMPFKDGLSAALFDSAAYGVVNMKGDIVIPATYSEIEIISSSLIQVKKDGKKGFINSKSESLTPLKYDEVNQLDNGLFAIKEKEKWGILNKQMKEVLTARYDEVKAFEYDLVSVGKGGKLGLIDGNGKEVVSPSYDEIEEFEYDLIRVKKDGKYGVISQKGKVIVSPEYDNVSDFGEGFIEVAKGELVGVVTSEGKKILLPVYEEVSVFTKDLIIVEKKEKVGLVNKKGKQIISFKYDYIGELNEGLAKVKQNDKAGFINEQGNEVIPVKYDFVTSFRNGKSEAQLNGETIFIDKAGKLVSENYNDLGIVVEGVTKERAETVFLDFLNTLVKEHPYHDDFDKVAVDSPFIIRNGNLIASFIMTATDGPVLKTVSAPVSKITEIWLDYNLGVSVADDAGVIQYGKPGSLTLDKTYKTDMLHLAAPGDGENARKWKDKLELSLKAVKQFYP